MMGEIDDRIGAGQDRLQIVPDIETGHDLQP